MSKNDGGQAFPHGDMVPGGCTGMTLRDYFTALQQKVTPLALPEVTDADAAEAECERVRSLKAIAAYGSAGVDERYDMAMRAALESYRARLMTKGVPND